MFVQRRNRNMIEAGFSTLALIYHVTVNNLRKGQRNALVGLLMTIVQSMMMIAGLLMLFWVLGVRRSPIRGDFLLFIMSGIFLFMTQTQTIGAVAGAGNPANQMNRHGPMNPLVMIAASALATLYKQTFSAFVILTAYHFFINPIEIENPVACYGVLLLAWFSGCCIGLIFLALRAWWPQGAPVATTFYQRINMVFSGKMFVANALSTAMLHSFGWNPLFHLIDQMRGFAFINYSPRNTSLEYPLYCTVALLMIGLMIEFVTRKSLSISSMAGR
ncbi:MAG TPA: ABC transporter [Paracoccus sp. (in: a-proteobacteria)]|uniref:ABC transporter permease n=1 Tax=Paracoccus sp. TaxID=267 RepID=UPI002C54C5DD|nr:ABC transporter [Paracoccus sp. (in: a-proteobacteria)]HWL55668.1 ABC transporter [Paracoccus sp. (in: a-proteobacteria)]